MFSLGCYVDKFARLPPPPSTNQVLHMYDVVRKSIADGLVFLNDGTDDSNIEEILLL